MTRVDENRDAQRIEDQRRAEQADKTKREANFQFQKLVNNQKQEAMQKASRDATDKSQQQASQKSTASAALMARQGIRSQTLNQALQKQGKGDVDKARVDNQARRSDVKETAIKSEERKEKLDTERVQRDTDKLAAISREDRREQGGGFGGADSGADSGQSGMDMSGNSQPGIPTPKGTAAQKTEQPQGAQAPRLSPEVIQQLVNRVFAGVTPEGLSQFTIELKSDVLGGARLDVTAKDGKISCTFHTDDKNIGRLLKASEGPLARAFAQKGLTLERLAVAEG